MAAAEDDHAITLEESRVAAMRQATEAFLDTLDDSQRAQAVTGLDDEAARTSWSNLPVNFAPRTGAAVAGMTTDQRKALHALMAAALSSQGYLKSTTIIWHEDVLHELVSQSMAELEDSDPRRAQAVTMLAAYDSELFYVKIYGDLAGADWGWTVTGHHYAANFTVSEGRIAFVPLFLGANPQIVPDGRYAGWRILQHEADRAFALMASLDTDQIAKAVIAPTVDDEAFVGKGQQARLADAKGIEASQLDDRQRIYLTGLIDEYLGNASDEAAARQRSAIVADGMDSLHFAWWGPVGEPGARYMFRVQGPSILIDYVREQSGGGGYNHVHSIVRDPTNDYGSDWLGRHYEEAHQD